MPLTLLADDRLNSSAMLVADLDAGGWVLAGAIAAVLSSVALFFLSADDELVLSALLAMDERRLPIPSVA